MVLGYCSAKHKLLFAAESTMGGIASGFENPVHPTVLSVQLQASQH